jgi:hypothetical protein
MQSPLALRCPTSRSRRYSGVAHRLHAVHLRSAEGRRMSAPTRVAHGVRGARCCKRQRRRIGRPGLCARRYSSLVQRTSCSSAADVDGRSIRDLAMVARPPPQCASRGDPAACRGSRRQAVDRGGQSCSASRHEQRSAIPPSLERAGSVTARPGATRPGWRRIFRTEPGAGLRPVVLESKRFSSLCTRSPDGDSGRLTVIGREGVAC